MDTFKYICCLIMGLCVIGCDDDDPISYARADFNNAVWSATAEGKNGNDGDIFLEFLVRNGDEFLRQSLAFDIPNNLGLYELRDFRTSVDSPNASFTTFTQDGDVIEEEYLVLELPMDSWLEITSYDESGNFIEGIFGAKFYIDPIVRPKNNPLSPDTVTFSNGEFSVYIK